MNTRSIAGLVFFGLAMAGALSACETSVTCDNLENCVTSTSAGSGTGGTFTSVTKTGGASSVAGASSSGGNMSTGGATGVGGAPTSTGGATGVGGAPTSTGGNSSTGGASSNDTFVGGSISTGGTVGTSGNATGIGGAATGGTFATGGIGTGGLATGGAGTGGFVSACGSLCTDSKPICIESAATCVECLENGNCPASRPACNLATHACVGCMADGYCSAPTPACNLATYTCVGCMNNAYCSSPTPACNTATNLCVQCTKDTNCSSATPACNTATNTCVQCTSNSNCTGTASLCDTSKNTCVECLSSNDCKNPTASLCSGGTCSPCAANADCSHITGKTVCKAVSTSDGDAGAEPGDAGTTPNECVQCTGTDYAACGQSSGKNLVCNSLTDTCSTSTEHSGGLCTPCVSDAQCKLGEMCVDEMFNGQSVGYFCFSKQGDTTNGAPASCISNGRPYSGVVKNAVSIDGETADICSLVTSTCTALNEYRSKDCTSSTNTANDGACGFAPGVDSKCASTSTAGIFLCTTTCLSGLDCLTGSNCDTGANPRVCTFP